MQDWKALWLETAIISIYIFLRSSPSSLTRLGLVRLGAAQLTDANHHILIMTTACNAAAVELAS